FRPTPHRRARQTASSASSIGSLARAAPARMPMRACRARWSKPMREWPIFACARTRIFPTSTCSSSRPRRGRGGRSSGPPGSTIPAMSAPDSPPLLTVLTSATARRDVAGGAYLVPAASVLMFTALTAVAAQISVPLPFTDVPLTLQPMVVLIGGPAPRGGFGAASQILYLAAGIAGLPVFAASATLPPGPLRLLGPTGGYLM